MQPWSKPGNWLQLVVLFLFLWYIISNRSSLSHFHWWSLFSFPLVVIVHLSNWQLFLSGWLSVIVGKHVCNEFISGSVPLILFFFFLKLCMLLAHCRRKQVRDNWGIWVLNLLPEFDTLPSLVVTNLVKVEILFV